MSRPVDSGVMDDSYAQDRAAKPSLRFRYEVRALAAVRAFQRHAAEHQGVRVLELGAAEGRTLLAMRGLLGGAGAYDGVELSDTLLASSVALPSNVRLLQGDVTALPTTLVAGSYDFCSALAVLEHLPDPMKALQEAFRMLKPAGVMVATCPHPVWDGLAGRLGMVRDEFHCQRLDGRQLVELFNRAGFERVTFEPFMWAPVAALPYVRFRVSPAFAARADQIVRSVRLLNFSFVNQLVVGVRPVGK